MMARSLSCSGGVLCVAKDRPFVAGATKAGVDSGGVSRSGHHYTRRALLATIPALLVSAARPETSVNSSETSTKKISSQFIAAFNKALSVSGDSEKADQAWTDVINLDPANSFAWSNRGTVRLQQGQWQGAKDDLEKALALESESGNVSGILLNNLGNACGALGDWDEAMQKFRDASLDEDVTPIALANLALALFQVEKVDQAIQEARGLVRKDPNFLDMRAALTAFLWASGREGEAESEWTQLQATSDGLGGLIYKREVAVKRVQGRWPPRAVAALDSFLKVSRQGQSLDYDKTKKTFSFETF